MRLFGDRDDFFDRKWHGPFWRWCIKERAWKTLSLILRGKINADNGDWLGRARREALEDRWKT